MNIFLKDIFEYHFEFNQRLFEEIEQHMASLPKRSFPLFCHILNAHQIWNARILKQEIFAVNQVHKIADCQNINQENYSNTLTIVDEVSLEKVIDYQNSKGETFSNKVSDILFHIANHSTHHRGQIISDFRVSGIKPIVTDYIFYKIG